MILLFLEFSSTWVWLEMNSLIPSMQQISFFFFAQGQEAIKTEMFWLAKI